MIRRLYIFILLWLIFYAKTAIAVTEWHKVIKGVEYTKLEYPRGFTFGQLHAFRIDPNSYQLKLSFANEYSGIFSGARGLTRLKQGILGVNGGFFTPQLLPLGLRVSDGVEIRPIKNTSWWAVFLMRGNTPSIVHSRNYHYYSDVDFAIQAGPRLIIDGMVPKLRDGLANRTALGITSDKKIVIVATQNLSISTTELANIMRSPEEAEGLDCVDALNLDGGSSTQLYANIKHFHVHVPSFVPVADAVVVVPRSQ